MPCASSFPLSQEPNVPASPGASFADIPALLRSPNPEDQREGAFLAAEAGMHDAIPLIVDLLRSPNPGVQEAVDMALRHLGGRRTVDALLLGRKHHAGSQNLLLYIGHE